MDTKPMLVRLDRCIVMLLLYSVVVVVVVVVVNVFMRASAAIEDA